MDPATRATLEALYAALLGAIVVLARVLGKPCPVQTRAERRAERSNHELIATVRDNMVDSR